jgi:hypothetical protein
MVARQGSLDRVVPARGPRPWLEHADLAPTMEGFPVAQMMGTLGQNETLPTFTFGLMTSPPRGAARLRRCRHVSQG